MSTKVPKWSEWRLSSPFAAPITSPLLAHHAALPKFPVPDLADTVSKALRSAKVLAKNEDEYEVLESKARDFVQGHGSELQSRLQARAAKSRNWLAEWWDDLAYMAYRDPVVINVSYFYGFEKLPQGPGKDYSKTDPSFVAATIALSAINFRDKLIDGSLTPDEAGGIKQDMEHYQWMMNSCRIPAVPSDYAVKVREDSPEGDHFIVIRKNRFYKVPISDQQGKRFTLSSLQNLFQTIYASPDKSNALPLGVLSGVNRDEWTKARNHLMSTDPRNVKSLDIIEKAAFVIALDENTPSTSKESAQKMVDFSRALWHGDGHNRFWDKPIQWIIFENGESGVIGEHSTMDGSPTARMNNDMTLALMAGKLPKDPDTPSQHMLLAEPLPFVIDATTEQHVASALDSFQQAIEQNQMQYLLYQGYGKNEIKAQKTSPDAWVQMIIQLAYAMTHSGKVVGTYESASVRRFDLGRTETVRVCTKESKAWVQSMLDPSTSNKERRELFKAAVTQHGKDMKDAVAGKGIDRHIFGLKLSVQDGEEMPAFLADPLLARSGKWVLSTSQVVGEHFLGYGWGSVVPDGYGVPYLLRNSNLQFTLGSKVGVPANELIVNLQRAADAVMNMFTQGAADKVKAKL